MPDRRRTCACQGMIRRSRGEPSAFEDRVGYEYLTLRGSEEHSVLLGVRVQTGNDLELLYWERRFERTYTRRGQKNTVQGTQ